MDLLTLEGQHWGDRGRHITISAAEQELTLMTLL